MTRQELAELIYKSIDGQVTVSYLPNPDGDEQLAITDNDGNQFVIGVGEVL